MPLPDSFIRMANGSDGRGGDLPIELPTTFKLIVNLRTARTLGIEVPMGLMMRADELIE